MKGSYYWIHPLIHPFFTGNHDGSFGYTYAKIHGLVMRAVVGHFYIGTWLQSGGEDPGNISSREKMIPFGKLT